MREYARITGLPEMPPLWSLGYQQSHRTLAGPDEVMSVAKTLREKKLPCDALIYLGTDFSPSGWNTHNGEFTWNAKNFPDPKKTIDELHALHFKVVLHIVIEGRHLTGTVERPCTRRVSGRRRAAATPDGKWPAERSVGCYWPHHKPRVRSRHRRLVARPGRRPRRAVAAEPHPDVLGRLAAVAAERAALTRCIATATPAWQRYGAFLWSGDVYSTWETLKTHVPVAINTGLSGIPYWGTDIGGFVPTPEFTGELYVRWFQFAAFCPLFRAHGRTWHLRLPWGWNTGELGPDEIATYRRRRRIRRSRAAQRAGRADLPEVSRAALSADAVPLFARCARPRRPACRSCARCGCTIRTIPPPSRAATSICGAATSSSRR